MGKDIFQEISLEIICKMSKKNEMDLKFKIQSYKLYVNIINTYESFVSGNLICEQK